MRLSNQLVSKESNSKPVSWIKRPKIKTKKKEMNTVKYSEPVDGKYLHSGKSGSQLLDYKGIKTLQEAKELCSKDKECMGITKQIMKSGKPKFTLRRFSKLSESTKPGTYTSWLKLE